MLKVNRLLLVIGMMVVTLLLSGCQTINDYFPYKLSGQEEPPSAPLPTDISKHEFELANGQTMIGQLAAVETQENDTLPDIARHFGLGYNDITAANTGISAWVPRANSRVLLPLQFILPNAPRKGIVLNVANMRLFYYPKKEPGKVYTYPVGIGRDGWNTPMGITRIAVKTPNPNWYVPPSIIREHAAKGHHLPNVVPSGPDNPLGYFAMRLAREKYLIHGTNKPFGIGMQISHGCVQMYPENIATLYPKVPVGTPVNIIHDPYLAAWHDNLLYLEANEPLENWTRSKQVLKKQVAKEIGRIAKKHNAQVDWEKVDRVLERANGVPTPVLANTPDVPDLAKTAMQLAHPGQVYGQPVAEELTDNDWGMLVATYNYDIEAKKLAAMLNHQGPPIPARMIPYGNQFQVIAGPFKSKKQALAVASRIRFDFEMDVTLIEPRTPEKVNVTENYSN